MGNRKLNFSIGEFYHVFNRGVDGRNIFLDNNDIERFIQGMIEFNSCDPIGSLYSLSFKGEKKDKKPNLNKDGKRLVNIICYCLNPNHYHLILEEVSEGGISEFMKRIGGYTYYFNKKHDRFGSLFQGVFKAVHIKSNEQLLHVSCYVNLNDHVHKLNKLRGETSKFVESVSSFEEYIGDGDRLICDKNVVLKQFKNKEDYKRFAFESLEDSLKVKEIANELKDLI